MSAAKSCDLTTSGHGKPCPYDLDAGNGAAQRGHFGAGDLLVIDDSVNRVGEVVLCGGSWVEGFVVHAAMVAQDTLFIEQINLRRGAAIEHFEQALVAVNDGGIANLVVLHEARDVNGPLTGCCEHIRDAQTLRREGFRQIFDAPFEGLDARTLRIGKNKQADFALKRGFGQPVSIERLTGEIGHRLVDFDASRGCVGEVFGFSFQLPESRFGKVMGLSRGNEAKRSYWR